MEDLLVMVTGPRETFIPMLETRTPDHLNKVLVALDKYQIELYVVFVRDAIRDKWDMSAPLDALMQAASWQDAFSIADLLSRYKEWQDLGKAMMPLNLSNEIVQEMGLKLYHSYIKAFKHCQGSQPASGVKEEYTLGGDMMECWFQRMYWHALSDWFLRYAKEYVEYAIYPLN